MPSGRVSQDWTGQIFNNCKILSPIDENKITGKDYWKTLCYCGKIFNAPPSSLKAGTYQSCGCYRIKASKERMLNQKSWEAQRKTYIGNEYNGCKVLEPINTNLLGMHSYYKIECFCGKFFKARVSNLHSGVIRSCGCAKLGTKKWHKERRIKNGFDPDKPMMEISEYFRHNFTKEIKDIIKQRDNNECQLCHIQDPGHMKVHHIIPIKEFMHSNNIEDLQYVYNHLNLILLCEPCHIYFAHNSNTAKTINKKIQIELTEICKNKIMHEDLLKKYNDEIVRIQESLKIYLSAKINS